jgi:hypothetical protein
MIVKIFDNGWGNHYPLKQYEQSVIDSMLAPVRDHSARTVVINSVWYTQDYHASVMAWLRQHEFDHIVLVAMLDAAIPYPDRYAEFERPVSTIGYYPGSGHIDFWALFVDRFMQVPSLSDIMDAQSISTPFMCLNRKPHWHRRRLYERMQELDLINKGLVSMGSDHGTAVQRLDSDTIHDNLAPNAGAEHYGVPNDIASLGHLGNWRCHFLNVVTETVYDINKTGFVSEKIYKPIVGCRPFLVYDHDGACAWLRNRGFEPYVDDFLDISDLDLSIAGNVAPFLRTLCNQPVCYFQKKFVDLRDKILYNNTQFQQHINQQKNILQQGLSCPI